MTELPRELECYRNRHRGATMLVAGCGRSVAMLAGRPPCPSIGVNDIGRAFDPDYLLVLNPREQFRDDRFRYVESTRAVAVFTNLSLGLRNRHEVRFRLGQRGGTRIDQPGRLPYTRNSPYVALCLARLMGATKIGLIGVDFTEDHFFARTGQHPLAREFPRIDAEYRALNEAARVEGVQIVNLSTESRLTAFPREDLRSFLTGLAPRPRRVVHVSLTNCAGAIWNLHGLLNDHGGIESRVVTASPVTCGRRFPVDILLSERTRVANALEEADVVHFHNTLDRNSAVLSPFRAVLERKPALLQLHSEPALLRPFFPGREPETRRDLPVLVVAQKQARFAPQAVPVPNAIDIFLPAYREGGSDGAVPGVVFTPTDVRDYPAGGQTCRGKGYHATSRILLQLRAEGAIVPLVRTALSHDEVLALRRRAAIGIDECVTGGYHLTSLECLAQGLVTVGWLDGETRALLARITGSDDAALPWVSTPLSGLAAALRALAADPERRASFGRAGRAWMERYWNPEAVLRPYLAAYDCAVSEHTPPVARVVLSKAPPGKAATTGRADPDGWHRRTLPGRSRPRRSEEVPQEVRLGPTLMSRRGALAGGTVHILGNGPSIDRTDLSSLANMTVIGTNASPLLDGRLGRAADYYCVSDQRFLSDPEGRRLAAGAHESLRVFAGYCHGFLDAPDINYVQIVGGDGVSDDLMCGFYHNCSVVLFAAQLALWLGARETVLHGCEYRYDAGRFRGAGMKRPHDLSIYPRVAANAALLARAFHERGGGLFVVGSSCLVGDFDARSVPGVGRLPLADAAMSA